MSSKRQRTGRRGFFQRVQQKLEEWQEPVEDDKKKKENEVEAREAARRGLVERKIQEAMEAGAFDNLPGKGQPLNLLTNPYLEPSQELAFNLLQHNGFAPEWIERDLAIRREIDTLRQRLRQSWQYYLDSPATHTAAWEAAIDRFARQLTRLNRQIDDFNLVVPVLTCQRMRLRLDDEIRRAQESD